MDFRTFKGKFVLGLTVLTILGSALSSTLLAKYVSNPFELDLTRTEMVGIKLRIAYYSSLTLTSITPFLVAWLTTGKRFRVPITTFSGVLAILLIIWTTKSVLHLWSELGGIGLP